MRIRKDAFPGPDERRRIVEEAQRAAMRARRLMEYLPFPEHEANRLFKLEYVEDGGGGGYVLDLTQLFGHDGAASHSGMRTAR